MAIRTYAPELSGAQAYRAPETSSPARPISARAIDAATVRATAGLVIALDHHRELGSRPDARVVKYVQVSAHGPIAPNTDRRPKCVYDKVVTPPDIRRPKRGKVATVVASQSEVIASLAAAFADRDNAMVCKLSKELGRTEKELARTERETPDRLSPEDQRRAAALQELSHRASFPTADKRTLTREETAMAALSAAARK